MSVPRSTHDIEDCIERLLSGDGLALLAQEALLSGGGVPMTMGPYRLETRLFGDAYSVFYRVSTPSLPHVLALRLQLDTERLAMIDSQKMALDLMHLHFAQSVDRGTLADGRWYAVYAGVPGPTLGEFCRIARVPLHKRLALMDDAFQALAFAHRHGWAHGASISSEVRINQEHMAQWPGVRIFGCVPLIIDQKVEVAASHWRRRDCVGLASVLDEILTDQVPEKVLAPDPRPKIWIPPSRRKSSMVVDRLNAQAWRLLDRLCEEALDPRSQVALSAEQMSARLHEIRRIHANSWSRAAEESRFRRWLRGWKLG